MFGLTKRLSENEKRSVILSLGCSLVFVLTLFAKSNYSAAVAYIVDRGIFTKAAAGLIASAFYICYGVGQFFGGRLADKWSPYKVVTMGVVGALIANIILCCTQNYTVIFITWSLNGIAQMGVYPGICKIMCEDILPEYRKTTSLHLTYGNPVGYGLSYVCSALVLENFGWSMSFGTSVILLVIALLIWMYAKKRIPEKVTAEKTFVVREEKAKYHMGFFTLLFASGLFFLMFPAISESLLSAGAQVWVSTMIMESYSVSSGFASLLTVIYFIAQILGLAFLASYVNKRKNMHLGYSSVFGITIIPLTTLIFIGKLPLALIVAMYSVVMMLTTLGTLFKVNIVMKFEKTGYSGTISGILNGSSALGIFIASSCYGIIADKWGWNTITFIWTMIAAVAFICCITATFLWSKFKHKI